MTKTNKAKVTGILTVAFVSMVGFSAFSGASAKELVEVGTTCAPVQSATVLVVDGDVTRAATKGFERVVVKDVLHSGDRLVVGSRSGATVRLGNDEDLELKADSELLLKTADRALCAVLFEARNSKAVLPLAALGVGGITAGTILILQDDDDDGVSASQQ